MLECVMQCHHVTECMSVSHSNTSNECIGLSAGYVNGMKDIKGNHSDGWTYHLVLDSRCPKSSGYVYSELIQCCYKIHGYDTSLQYADYEAKCGIEGAELMRIDSEEKQLFVGLFLDYFDVTNWILFQGSHLIAEEHWRYNDGSIFTYFNWYSGQPDSSGTAGQTEVIGMMKIYDYKWHDLWLNYKGAFLCEKRTFD
ncbi:galactose-specific lectin nattectin-like [Mytilus trossulus]|uniref:galactose-specific lectin nattectin-like n=1 Tax=Mytilus trossulus TaxID=6551 RepID=UPI0030040A44